MHADGPDPDPADSRLDLGVGGLTVLHECLVSLPEEDYVYLGDDARFPYGAKSAAQLGERTRRNTAFLLDRGAKLIVIACNSAAGGRARARARGRRRARGRGGGGDRAGGRDRRRDHRLRPRRRARHLATVAGGAYLRALGRQHRELTVTQVAAPDLAAIIQRGFPFSEAVVETVRSYCAPLKRARVDTVILAAPTPARAPDAPALGREVRLVTAGHALAATAQRILEARGLQSPDDDEGEYRFRCAPATRPCSASSAAASCRDAARRDRADDLGH